MIYSLTGEIVDIIPFDGYYEIIVECLGIGYCIKTSDISASECSRKGNTGKFYTYLYVRENLIELFGFASSDELDWFKLLTSVSGVGPKAALSILSGISYRDLVYFVSEGDFKKIVSVKGIGNKTAQRIVIELKDKIKKFEVKSINASNISKKEINFNENVDQAFEALRSLGFTDLEIKSVLKDVDTDSCLEDIIKCSLKLLSK